MSRRGSRGEMIALLGPKREAWLSLLPGDPRPAFLASEPFARFGGRCRGSCYMGFEDDSFGQKKQPSPWATAKVCGLLSGLSPVIAGRKG
jgi:hypothetical protein